MSPRLVVFEGLDGSGKSTCARALARRTGAVFMTTPGPDLRRLRGQILEGLGCSQEAHALFYLSTVFSASQRIRGLLEQGRYVVVDRYFLSTAAYAEFRGSAVELDQLQAWLQPADVTVYLDTSLEVRRQRIAARGASAADLETLCVSADRTLRRRHLEREGLAVVGRLVMVPGDAGGPEHTLSLVCDALAL